MLQMHHIHHRLQVARAERIHRLQQQLHDLPLIQPRVCGGHVCARPNNSIHKQQAFHKVLCIE